MIPQSDIHSKYGDWRKNMKRFGSKYGILTTSDLDTVETSKGNFGRIWTETDCNKNRILCWLDLKYLPGDTVTKNECIVFNELASLGYKIYVVYLVREELTDDSSFYICEYGTDKTYKITSGKNYAEWLYQMRDGNYKWIERCLVVDMDELRNFTSSGKGDTIMFELKDAKKKGGPVKELTTEEQQEISLLDRLDTYYTDQLCHRIKEDKSPNEQFMMDWKDGKVKDNVWKYEHLVED